MKQGYWKNIFFFFFFFFFRESKLISITKIPFPSPHPSIQFWGPWSFGSFNLEVIAAVGPGYLNVQVIQRLYPQLPTIDHKIAPSPSHSAFAVFLATERRVLEATGKEEGDRWMLVIFNLANLRNGLLRNYQKDQRSLRGHNTEHEKHLVLI